MPRILKTSLLLATLIVLGTLGCKSREGPADGNVILLLPESKPAPDNAPERMTKLTIDGKDEPIKAGPDREFSVKIDASAGKTVSIVYSFWPQTYSNTIRTKTVKLEAGKPVKVDFHKADADNPDRIREGAAEGNVILLLPESRPAPEHAPERVPKLTINGKDEPIKAGPDRELGVKIDAGAGTTVSIVFSFWPYTYSNTIRTKKVKLEADKPIKVDFHKTDADVPDDIRPIYYPTPHTVVVEMCKMGKVGEGDVVYDFGCGDGRLVIAAVKKFNAKKGVGVDIDPGLIKLCKENAEKDGVSDKVEFRNEDALKIKDLSDATVVLLYVGEDFGKALEPVLRKTLKPGARVVSHRFPLGDWAPDEEKKINCKNNDGNDEDYVLKMWTIKK